ncbi:hypothetical protein [Halomicrobium urmianum]|uniref:hypothetical protein n=1 Tax=Halomicrobium urmianum TaxID=1586233 RepID=UPI001CD9C166|nr:hypothetical protein [Halomicrobium urmianum]
MEHNATVDRIAAGLGSGLVLLGVVVLGLVETLAGKPYGAAPLTNDAGEVIATPLIDPTLRTGLVIAGLVVLGLYALYRIATPEPGTGDDAAAEVVAD